MKLSKFVLAAIGMTAVFFLSSDVIADNAALKLAPGSRFSIQFPNLPPTYWNLDGHPDDPVQMTVCLPLNYTPTGKFPLLIYFHGGNGENGDLIPAKGVPTSITQSQDFVCVGMQLFKAIDPKKPGGNAVMHADDAEYMLPLFRTMMAKLHEVVPNIDRKHMVLSGFSNGGLAIQRLLEVPGGEIAHEFCAFVIIEGGRFQQWELLKGKPYLMVLAQARALPIFQPACDQAKAAGVDISLILEDIGHHGIPQKAYPAIHAWLIGPGMGKADATPAGDADKAPAEKSAPATKGTDAATN